MRIAIVSPGYPPTAGGVESVVAHTARALVRAGHAVDVLAAERCRDLPDVTDDNGVAVYRFTSTRSANFPVAPGMWQFIRNHSAHYDVVHGHGYHTVGALGAALAAPSIRFVYSPHYHGTGHSPTRARLHRVYRPVGGLGLRRAAAVVCVSQAEAALVGTHFPWAERRITVVPNAVDVATIRTAQPFASDVPTVLSVGRLETYKRVDRLVQAFAQVPVPARLVVVGEGPDRSRLMSLAGGTVRFLGRVEDADLHRWYRTARVLCGLSEHEAFGLTAVEAIAAGARAVLSDIPAHAELSRTVGGIRLVGAYDDVPTAITDALVDRDFPAVLGIPDWDDVAKRLLAVYAP